MQRTSKGRLRHSAAKSFLNPVKSRKNLHIITHAHTTSVTIEKGRPPAWHSVGVGAMANSGRYLPREVILSAGVVGSPHLLELSGIGDSNRLSELGIDVVHHLPGVGENLRDHYVPRFTGRAKNTSTINEMTRGPKLLWEIVKYALGQTFLLSGSVQLLSIVFGILNLASAIMTCS